ncbi:unnamed protein product [Oppiella nova]|uniref:Sodium-coupled monocarboxylate transporter 1 n=1 Tax=Oppiella nova TaxID=334625 RepID=A0A7R9M5M6_9ACAR|nr:unnamed protein product [Oppiella nova]CAG2171216.1 unnamed protein product [Oppiella nova]
MLIVSALIGLYYWWTGRGKSSANEFLMANRSMSVLPVSMSVMASFISAIALIGIPAEVYIYGLQNWAMICSFPVVMYVSAYMFMPVFYELQITSTYEVVLMSIVLYGPALAISQLTGMGLWFSVITTGVVCTFYTTIGGMKAVVWTDVFQTTLMFAMMGTVVVKGVYDLGGLHTLWDINNHFDRIELFNLNPNPFIRHTFWTVFFGSVVHWTNIYATNQAMVQRYLTIPTLKRAQMTLLIVWPLKTTIICLSCLAGLVVFAKYSTCDPMSTKRIERFDQLFPLYVIQSFSFIPGFVGLFIAGVFSGSLSTISSGVNSLSAVTLQDFIRPFLSYKMSDSAATLTVKVVAVFYGLLSIALVLLAQQMGNILQAAIALFGLLGSPVFGLFILGMFVPTANSKGAFWGTLLGISCSLWVGVGAMMYKPYLPKKPISVESRTSIAEMDSTLFTPLVRKHVERLQRLRIEDYIQKEGPEKAQQVIASALIGSAGQLPHKSHTDLVLNNFTHNYVNNNNTNNSINSYNNDNYYLNEAFISALIGLYYWWTGRGKSSANEFLMANRSMSVLPVSMSVMATFISAIALLGFPAEVYIYGLQNWAVMCSFPIVMYVSAYMFMPVFYELQITSTFEVC